MNEHLSKLSNTSDKREIIWTPLFIQLFTVNAILNFGHFMMSTLLPQYAEHLGASAASIGVVAGAFAITALAVRPIVGPSISYFRMDRLFAAAIGIILASFFCFGLADSVPMLLVGRLLQGIGMGFLVPVSMAMVSNTLPDHKLASGIGLFSLGQVMAMAIGPWAGLSLVQQFGYRGIFIVGSALVGLALVLSLRLKTKRPHKRARFTISLHNMIATEAILPAVMMFFLAGAQACIQAFILIYGGVNGVKDIGLFFTSYAVFVLISRPVCGRIADKYGMDKVLIPGILIFALSFVVISFSHTLPMFLAAGAISAFGYGICHPLIQTLCIQLVSKDRRGVASNTNYIGVDIGYLIMPTVAGFIVSIVQEQSGSSVIGYESMFRIMTIPIIVALVIFLIYRKRLKLQRELSGNQQ